MKSVFQKHKVIILFLALALVVALAASLMPWQRALEGQLKSMLAARGFENVSLNIAGLGWKGLTLENISFGGETPLSLRNVALDYTLDELRNKTIGGLKITGLELEMRKSGDQWVVVGLEGVMNRPAAAKQAFALPVSGEMVDFIPFNRLSVEDSRIRIHGGAWHIALPLALQAEKAPVPKLSYEAREDIRLTFGAIEAVAGQGRAELVLSPEEELWAGRWTLDNIMVSGLPEDIPPLTGEGTISADGKARIRIEGGLTSADRKYRLDFRYENDLNQTGQAALTVLRADLPWKGGALGIQNTRIPLNGQQDLRFNLQVKGVSIDALLQAVTGKRVSATGLVSGSIPVVIARDGSFTLKKGILKAQGPGSIHMPPDAIPGDNAQIELVRDILSDLRYDRFSIETESDADNNFAVLLALEGHNPAVYNGRAVNLNVRLTGDVLDFIQQNLMLLNNPEKLLKAGKE